MKFLIDLISEQLAGAFERAGFDAAYGKATLSNRPDLCEYQCNGALAAAKQYHKAPIQIANAVLDALGENELFSSAEAVMPGFLNLKISEDYLASYLREMAQAHTTARRTILLPAPSFWTTAGRTSQSPCTSDTCAAPSSANHSSVFTGFSAIM